MIPSTRVSIHGIRGKSGGVGVRVYVNGIPAIYIDLKIVGGDGTNSE
jgi:hypothetical protein